MDPDDDASSLDYADMPGGPVVDDSDGASTVYHLPSTNDFIPSNSPTAAQTADLQYQDQQNERLAQINAALAQAGHAEETPPNIANPYGLFAQTRHDTEDIPGANNHNDEIDNYRNFFECK